MVNTRATSSGTLPIEFSGIDTHVAYLKGFKQNRLQEKDVCKRP